MQKPYGYKINFKQKNPFTNHEQEFIQLTCEIISFNPQTK